MKRPATKKSGMEKALISASLVQNKSFSLQRLMHDYNEITHQVVPIPGVSALPLDDDFYEWHGNVKGVADNIYKGAVLHFKISFPKNYPISPPTVYLLNNQLKHPNIMPDRRICLDMFEKDKGGYKGWKSGYTVLSILLQLQMFFFDVEESFLTVENKKEIQESLIAMAEFKCSQCKHRGSSNPYPEFPKINEQNTKMTQEQYKEAKKKELCCYHRKVNFEEAHLGLGLSITKIPRTGEIKGINPRFDFIAYKTYAKERLRVSFNGEPFTHWFPLYFGVEKTKNEFLNGVKKAISMIAKGNTREFKSDLILKVMPKFFNYICLNIMSEKVHNSSRAIEILIYIYRILIMLAKEFPEFKEAANKSIEEFIKNPEQRIKEKTPSLGDLLVMLSISDHKIEELLPAYISEQMDRQIFWILQEIPKFEELINKDEVDDIRAKVCFKCGITGQQLLLFYYYFMNKVVYSECDSLDKFAEKLDQNYSCLTETEIDQHRLEMNKILKIDNFPDFYKFMNLKIPSKDELNQKLKQAFVNSKNKKYHGTDEVRYVPPPSEQVKFYMKRYEPFENLIKDGHLLPAEDPKWKELLNSFDIVKQYKYTYPNQEMTPLNVIRLFRDKYSESLFFDIPNPPEKKSNNRIGEDLNKKKFVKNVEDEEIIKTLTWRQLYIKLYLEDYCKFFPYIGDFKQLYSILDNVKGEVIHFVLFTSNFGILKSDYNYIRAIFTKLTSLKYLELVFTQGANIKLLKNLVKGISNALKEKTPIEHLKIISNPNSYNYSNKELNILTILDNMPSLKILDLSNVTLNLNNILRIRNHLYYYKKITVLDLSYCNLNDEMSNELADGIMKAKGLEKLYIKGNKLVKGLSTILYNLAFQPSIKIIDISDNQTCDKKETSISLHKLIKMSQTVDTIIANNLTNFNKELTNDFYYALGDNNNLAYLDLSKNGNFSNVFNLGMAISFNALKNGSLSYLDISFCGFNWDTFNNLIKGMKVSENDHNKWYGFQFNSNIAKESPQYYNREFHCNLEAFIFNGNNLYSNINYLDPKNAKEENLMKTFLTESPKLETLTLCDNNFNKFFLDAFADALRTKNSLKYLSISNSRIDGEKFKSFLSGFYAPIPLQAKEEKSSEEDKKEKKEKKEKKAHKKEIIERIPNPNFHIEVLDLSCNQLGYSGIETLSNALKINKTIKKLNLFHNLFDVNGARRIGEVLKINKHLEELDIGYNRIKNSGFKNIIESMKENKNLKFLGLKYNFINDKIFEDQFNILEENKDISLEEMDLKNNSITPGFLMKFWEDKFTKMTKKIKVDLFDVLTFMEPDRLERSVWIPTGEEAKRIDLYNEIERREKDCIKNENSHVGIPLFIRKKRGRKTGKKKENKCRNVFIEFIMPNSVNRMLKLASMYQFSINGKNRKIFKAGTKPDYLVVKKRVTNI
jgi:ubiquitin-protein ligase/Ran GTPase-activating protein (RanGAP) involved in mRNA processing and transport